MRTFVQFELFHKELSRPPGRQVTNRAGNLRLSDDALHLAQGSQSPASLPVFRNLNG